MSQKRHRGFKLSDPTNAKLKAHAQARGTTETAIVEAAVAHYDTTHPLGRRTGDQVDELCGLLDRARDLAQSVQSKRSRRSSTGTAPSDDSLTPA